MKKFLFFLFIFSLIISYQSCHDDITNIDTKFNLYQLPGCHHSTLLKASTLDSCFTYTFDKDLSLEFCVEGNCCPDSNRFLSEPKFFRDTITISVTDTARNLCKCICNYVIHAEFRQLPQDSYIIKCVKDKSSVKKLLYIREVKRK